MATFSLKAHDMFCFVYRYAECRYAKCSGTVQSMKNKMEKSVVMLIVMARIKRSRIELVLTDEKFKMESSHFL
jgi:hypothetical protein